MDTFAEVLHNKERILAEVVTKLNADFACQLEVYTVACPVQIVGTFDRQPFLFHARFGDATVTIGDYEYVDDGYIDNPSWATADEVDHVIRTAIYYYCAV